RDRGRQARRMRRRSGRGAGDGDGQAAPIGANRCRITSGSGGEVSGMPLGEIALLVGAVVLAGIATGILAGLFGIGGGAAIVPVLYEIFQIFEVPDEVRMQLCVGTSMAIIVPTTIR